MPSQTWFGTRTTGPSRLDPSGSTCSDAAGNPLDCSDPAAIHYSGIPGGRWSGRGLRCGERRPEQYAPALDLQPVSGTHPLPGRALRHAGLRGSPASPRAPIRAACMSALPRGSHRGGAAARRPNLRDSCPGTKNGDAAIVEKYAERRHTAEERRQRLPLTAADLAGGILVTGGNANHTVADPTNEASTGMRDRNAVNPLQQLKAFSGNPGAFTFVPANDRRANPCLRRCCRRRRTRAGWAA